MNSVIKKIEEIAALSDISKEEKSKALFSDIIFTFNTSHFLSDLEINSIYGRRFARYILRKVDFLLDAPLYSEKRSSYNEMSVEHILPQNPEDGSQWSSDFSIEDREEWTHKLGNLVLISRRKNSGQGRLDFADKKTKYFNSSIESFPNSLRIMQKPIWTVNELKTNHSQLISKIKMHYNI
jgi:hypothetical protein